MFHFRWVVEVSQVYHLVPFKTTQNLAAAPNHIAIVTLSDLGWPQRHFEESKHSFSIEKH